MYYHVFTRKLSKFALAACATNIALLISMPVGAQSISTKKPSVSGQLEDVVVTAQRRTQSVQKLSLNIQVVNAQQLTASGVTMARDLSALVPGLQIALGGNETQMFIRGVGDESSTGLGQSAVAFNVNGVYVADQAAYAPVFYDVERVEVLKGPQGTLYGRNSSAGAVNIIDNRPTRKLSADLSSEFGNYGLKHVSGDLNFPVSSTLSVRGAFNVVDRNGYLSDQTDDDKQQDGRLSVLWKPIDNFSALIVGDVEQQNDHGGGQVLLPTVPGTNPWTGLVNATNNALLLAKSGPIGSILALPGSGPNPAPFAANNLLDDSFRRNVQRNISAEFNYNIDSTKLTFLPAYRSSSDNSFNYSSGFPFGVSEQIREQSDELRLSKENDRLKLTVGLYYFNERDNFNQFALISPLVAPLDTQILANLGTQSYAGFGQATINVTPSFRLIGGVRYTDEHKTMGGSRIMKGITPYQTSNLAGTATFKASTFRAGTEYDVTSSNMIYATISNGFKSGGFNTFEPINGISNVYQPETLMSYDAGSRNRFFENRLQINVEGFYWDYKNAQESHLTYDPYGNLQFETLNAASATVYGADIDTVGRVTPNDTLSASLELSNSYFNNFAYQIPTGFYSPGSTACGASASGVAGFTSLNCSNRPLPRAPHWSGNASYQHEFDLGDNGSITGALSFDFAGRRYLAVDYTKAESAPSYYRTNITVTYTTADGKYSIAGFVRNAGNAAVYLGGIETATAPGYFLANIDAPRTFGARLTAHF